MPTEPRIQTHVDIFNYNDRQRWAQNFGVTEERLRKAVRLVGPRLSIIAAYLDRPEPQAKRHAA